MITPNTNDAPEWVWRSPVAHRGLHDLALGVPENSLRAFRAAAAAGYPMEMDVRLLRSGEVVVFHDADWLRMTGQAGVVEETDIGALTQLRLAQTGDCVPLLRDVLETIAGRTPLLIELKSHADVPVGPLEDAVLQTLRGYEGLVALQAFRKETVTYLVQNAPKNMPIGQLASNDKWTTDSLNDVSAAPHFLGYIGTGVPSPITTAFRENGGPVLVWTLTSNEQQELLAPHCDNIIFENFRPVLPGAND